MAKTTGVISGNRLLVFSADEVIACTTGATFNGTNEEIDTTCKDNDGASTSTPGAQTWSIDVTGNAKYDAAYGLEELQQLFINKNTVTVRFGTENADDSYLEGQAYVSSLSIDAPLNAPATWSITFSPRGPIRLFNS